jgi:hypothetical protein
MFVDPGRLAFLFFVVFASVFVATAVACHYRDRARRYETLTRALLETCDMDRKCPFCGVPVDCEKFCCRAHWACLTESDKKVIWDAYADWQNHKIAGAKLREIQAAVVARYPQVTGRSPAAALAGVDRRQLEAVCLLFARFLAKDDEYRKCKEQFVDAKKKLGMEHRQLRKAVDQLLHEILHPGQTQPALFDNSPDRPPPPKLPD